MRPERRFERRNGRGGVDKDAALSLNPDSPGINLLPVHFGLDRGVHFTLYPHRGRLEPCASFRADSYYRAMPRFSSCIAVRSSGVRTVMSPLCLKESRYRNVTFWRIVVARSHRQFADESSSGGGHLIPVDKSPSRHQRSRKSRYRKLNRRFQHQRSSGLSLEPVRRLPLTAVA